METRKCKVCKEIKNLENEFYKTGYTKKNGDLSYQNICKKCFSKRNIDNRDKDIEHFENDFDYLPRDIKTKIALLSVDNTSIKEIATKSKCKYQMVWYAKKAKQIQKYYKRHILKS